MPGDASVNAEHHRLRLLRENFSVAALHALDWMVEMQAICGTEHVFRLGSVSVGCLLPALPNIKGDLEAVQSAFDGRIVLQKLSIFQPRRMITVPITEPISAYCHG